MACFKSHSDSCSANSLKRSTASSEVAEEEALKRKRQRLREARSMIQLDPEADKEFIVPQEKLEKLSKYFP